MVKKRDKKNKKGYWIKAVLGIFFLVLNRVKKKETISQAEMQIREKIKLHEKERTSVHTALKSVNKEQEREKELEEKNKGWIKAQPEKLPSPTYWPFFLALGLVFLLWGIISSWVILAVGLLLFIIALSGWINILRHEK